VTILLNSFHCFFYHRGKITTFTFSPRFYFSSSYHFFSQHTQKFIRQDTLHEESHAKNAWPIASVFKVELNDILFSCSLRSQFNHMRACNLLCYCERGEIWKLSSSLRHEFLSTCKLHRKHSIEFFERRKFSASRHIMNQI
jgi:hypothetical protein